MQSIKRDTRILFALLLPTVAMMPGPSLAQELRPLLAFGDSITIGFRESGVDCSRPVATAKGYTEHLEELLADQGLEVDITPLGICGETTQQAVTRIDQVLASREGDLVLIMEGTNDISAGGADIVSNELILNNLTIMAQKTLAAGRIPLLASIIPYGPNITQQQTNNLRAGNLAEDIRQWTEERGLPFADPFNFLISVPNIFQTYYHPDSYHLNATGNELLASAFRSPTAEAVADLCEPGPCQAGPETLCLADGRFKVELEWEAGDQTGMGQVQPLVGGDTGTVWFFNPENIEMVVKVLDGRCSNGAFWVFYGALSDVQFRLKVTDTETCKQAFYLNPRGTIASAGDTRAFIEACPDSP